MVRLNKLSCDMELKDYTTEELKAELKRRTDLAKDEKSKIKRCRMCIPYNDETKHLVGTTDEAHEYYRYWED